MLVIDEITAASMITQTPTFFIAGGADLKNPVFWRTATELESASKVGSSEEQLAMDNKAE